MGEGGYVAGLRGEDMLNGVLVRKPEGKRALIEMGIDGRIVLRWIFGKWNLGVWTGSLWLRKGTSGGHLWMRFGFHKMPGIS